MKMKPNIDNGPRKCGSVTTADSKVIRISVRQDLNTCFLVRPEVVV